MAALNMPLRCLIIADFSVVLSWLRVLRLYSVKNKNVGYVLYANNNVLLANILSEMMDSCLLKKTFGWMFESPCPIQSKQWTFMYPLYRKNTIVSITYYVSNSVVAVGIYSLGADHPGAMFISIVSPFLRRFIYSINGYCKWRMLM